MSLLMLHILLTAKIRNVISLSFIMPEAIKLNIVLCGFPLLLWLIHLESNHLGEKETI